MRGGKVQSNSVDILGVAVSRVNSVQVNVLIGSDGQEVTINLGQGSTHAREIQSALKTRYFFFSLNTNGLLTLSSELLA